LPVSNRGLANRALYLSRILLNAWAAAQLTAEDRQAVDAAFLASVRQQLRRAYGWFLLSVSGAPEELQPQCLPREVAALAPPPPGRALAAELREFAALERSGWLAELLQEPAVDEGAGRDRADAIASDRIPADRAAAERWFQSLQSSMDRMDDSLQEC